MLGLAAAARGAPFLARGVVSSRRQTSRVVIARTIIDGTTSMRESPDCIVFSISRWRRRIWPEGRLSGFRRTDHPFGSHSRGTKGILATQEIFGSAFCQNFDNVPPRHIMDSWCGNGATRRRALANRTPLRGKTRSERFRFHALSIGNGGLVDMHQVALSEAIEYLGYETAETDRRR